jgi:hypothetical protein
VKAPRTFALAVLAATLGTTALAACGSEAPEQVAKPPAVESQDVSEGVFGPGDAIPLPKGERVLSISGLISNVNDDDETTLDVATLEKMSMVKLRVFEPFEKKEMVFEGVLMSELMKIIGADSSATEVHLTALDDYKIDLPMSVLKKADVLLATKADGNHMSIVDGGPTRIIFPPDSDMARNTDMWIWNVDTMVVR